MRVLVSALFLFLCLQGSQAIAEDIDPEHRRNQISVGFFLGGFLASDEHEFFNYKTSVQKELDPVSADVGVRVGYLPLPFVGAEVEGNLVAAGVDGGGRASLFGLRAHLIGQLPMLVTPFAVAGLGVLSVSTDDEELGKDTDVYSYLGAGAKYRIKDEWVLRGDLRLLAAPKAGTADGATSHFEFLLGLSYDIGATSSQVQEEEELVVVVQPQEPVDADSDGLVGAADQCPSEAENFNNFEDEDGCPDEIPDSDRDGLSDRVDECPGKAEDKDGFEDDDGCPDLDNDGDGITDLTDLCPAKTGPPENRGCPDEDRDGDTVVDRLDNCPDEKGTVNNRGCAAKQLVVITSTQLEILDRVFFRSGKDVIQKRSFALLDNIAAVLNSHPEIKTVQIAGHTDDKGKAAKNLVLSQKRAEAVARYLVGKGVHFNRIKPKGFGEDAPAVEGSSRKAREANRRVEFKISKD